MIELQSVTKLYGTVIGVNDISLSLAAGAFGLVGPNGSGKSTLLNLITGQLRPTLGTVRVLERSPWNCRKVAAHMGVCPEQDILYPNITARDWISYLLQLRGWTEAMAAGRSREVLDEVGLGEAQDRRMGTYSRGMRQRAKLAQALAHHPKLLILDEPFNGLDPVGRHEMAELIKSWVDEEHIVILASHVLHEVESITDTFLLICDGRLLASGSIREVNELLADVPNEIRLRCDQPTAIAGRLVQEQLATHLRFEEQGDVIVFSTPSPALVYDRLPNWVHETGARVSELRCEDDSLHALFRALLEIHRGQTG